MIIGVRHLRDVHLSRTARCKVHKKAPLRARRGWSRVKYRTNSPGGVGLASSLDGDRARRPLAAGARFTARPVEPPRASSMLPAGRAALEKRLRGRAASGTAWLPACRAWIYAFYRADSFLSVGNKDISFGGGRRAVRCEVKDAAFFGFALVPPRGIAGSLGDAAPSVSDRLYLQLSSRK